MRRVIKAHQLTAPPELWRAGQESASRATAAVPDAGERSPDWGELEAACRGRGLAEGMRLAEEAYQAKLARLESLGAQLQAERTEFFDRLEPELVRLAVAISEKVIQQELETRPELVVDMVRSAMKRLRERESLRVSVNPRDVERVREARDDLLSAVDGVKKIEVVEDRRVDAGGCVIESPNGTLDARIRTQIGEIEKALEAVAPVAGQMEGGEDHGSGSGTIPGSD